MLSLECKLGMVVNMVVVVVLVVALKGGGVIGIGPVWNKQRYRQNINMSDKVLANTRSERTDHI